ncbi:Flagellar operon protein [Tepidanaerobacter acetatoxydans Re1]|jgi:flagellar operon protein|uniref:Flagellar operon protein n=3 Tax=Tepidanaerobacter acetatoxydans TaxID=499229 RepID=F4LTP3_TEPAE|nr:MULTISPECIES: TIGR02530 family flagellar biosynthesis protein [Tepidanaerobacter]AEE91373.1 flagellar operon protein [Tepidanaerobacter acetatoxydans Re1]CCP26069.1 Flagellar operon protein [Tepidanaerobacter acetatoxydans Re1]
MQDYSKIQSGKNIGISPISTGVKKLQTIPEKGFDQILQQKIEDKELKISQHAQMRMNMRNIKLTKDQKEMINNAVDKAEQKGVRESLILMNDMAFVVSIKNRTVITAMNGDSVKENVFTNIDGAVIL